MNRLTNRSFVNLSRRSAFVALVAALVSAGTAQATTIIYQDNFSRSGALNGTQLGVASGFTGSGLYGGSPTATWSADSGITTNGTSANSSGSPENAFLPFSPVSGNVYTFTLNLNNLSTNATNSAWVGMGFNASTTTSSESYGTAAPWVILWSGGSQATSSQGPGYTNNYIYNPGGTDNTYSWVLNATGGLNAMTAQLYENNVPEGALYTYSSNPNITSIGFISSNSGSANIYSVSSFQLTQAPEPSSVVLCGLGAAGLLIAARRRRKA